MSKVLVALTALAGVFLTGSAMAQAPASGEQPFKQIKLNDAHIKGFIAAQKEMAALAEKQGSQSSDAPDPKIQAELDAIAKRHGFKDFVDFDDIAFNISMVMGGLDPQSGAYTDPITAIKKEMEDIKGDASIPEKDKKQMLEELNEALKHTPPLQFPSNVDLVKRYRTEIEKVLQ